VWGAAAVHGQRHGGAAGCGALLCTGHVGFMSC
jgi:hypothetical protein